MSEKEEQALWQIKRNFEETFYIYGFVELISKEYLENPTLKDV